MVLTADPPGTPAPRSDPRSTLVRLRSRYIDARDSSVTVAVYVGDPPVLVDGCVIEELSWSWGSTSDNGVVTVADAGTGTLVLLDPSRRFDPTNDDSAEQITEIGTRVQVVVAGVPAFTGRVDDLHHDLVTARISLVDSITSLASVSFVETAVPAETAAARIGRILDLAAWPAGQRDVTAGGVNLQAGTVAADAWSELVEVNRNELGALWIRPDGVVAFRPRAVAWQSGQLPVMEFGCPPSDSPLLAINTRADPSDLVNVLAAARRTGTQRVVTDQASLDTYGRHSHVQNDLELATDVDRDAWEDFYIRRQATPARGVAGFTCRPGAAAIAKALALPFGAIVHVTDEGHGPTIDRNARWVGTRWDIGPNTVELSAITGEDASIRQVPRYADLDTPAQWAAALPWANVDGDVVPFANGSFETGNLAGWAITDPATVAAVVADASTGGTYACRFTGPATGSRYPGITTPTSGAAAIAVVPGITYKLRAYGKRLAGTATGLRVDLNATNASGAVVTAAVVALSWGPNTSGAGAYQEGYWTAPTDGSVKYLAVVAYLALVNPTAAEQWLVDAITVTGQGNTAYLEPGLVVETIPPWPSGGALLRDLLGDLLVDRQDPGLEAKPAEDGD